MTGERDLHDPPSVLLEGMKIHSITEQQCVRRVIDALEAGRGGWVFTPNIDHLASQGVRCTDFYIGSPSCMPSRGALMTGRHPVRNGLNEQIYLIDELEQTSLPHREILFPRYMKELGYATACFGKW